MEGARVGNSCLFTCVVCFDGQLTCDATFVGQVIMGQTSSKGVSAHMETAMKTGALVLSDRRLTEVNNGLVAWS